MIEKVVIRDNTNSPVHYIEDIPIFKNGTEYIFKPGVNIIVGENGSGKTTLLKIIELYLLIYKTECSFGEYNHSMRALVGLNKSVPDGIDVYADYVKNTFRLCHLAEKTNDDIMSNFSMFGDSALQMNSSTGESVNIAINSLFRQMFSKDAKLKFDYEEAGEREKSYKEYVQKHRVETHDEWTILMDEPDRNLDIENIEQIKGILSFHKPQTQIIAVVHNPLLIYALSKNEDINFIELTPNYIYKVRREVDNILK